MLGTMLIAGFYSSNIPVWISWIKYFSITYYGYNLGITYEFSGKIFPCVMNNSEYGDCSK
eukprot:Pgem_evm1s13784